MIGTFIPTFMFSLAIIIPCYNEADRLEIKAFESFLRYHPQILLIFVNDGSIDNTEEVLVSIQLNAPQNTVLLANQRNAGKGESIRKGMFYCIEKNIPFIGYTDADLSAPLSEIKRLYEINVTENADLVIGSRIKKSDTTIIRSGFRHFIGRIIATIIDNKFRLGCYDTQCGAKVFKLDSLKDLIQAPFLTKWFFDVELLLRYRKVLDRFDVLEVPLSKWINKPGSKMNISKSGLVLKELYYLLTKYS